MDVVTAAGLMGEMRKLEVAADENGFAQQAAIAEMAQAIREHGAGSPEAIAAEAKADALFDEGEALVARLLEIEAALRVVPAAPVVAEAA